MWDWFAWGWNELGDHAGPLEALVAILFILSLIFFPVRLWWAKRQPPQMVTLANPEVLDPLVPVIPPTGSMHMDLATFEALQERALEQAKKQLAAAQGEEIERLEETIEALKARLRNPDEALAQQQAIIIDLEEKLARRGNEIGGDELTAAKTALEAGDFTKARALFEALAARTAPEVAANADAEFALGQIAEVEIRWHDAYRHYKRAAQLSDTLNYQNAYVRLALRLGYAEEAFDVQQPLSDAVKAKYGDTSVEYASQVSTLAKVHKALENYPKAEDLCRQALEITITNIVEAHSDYSAQLYDLAWVLSAQGRKWESGEIQKQAMSVENGTDGQRYRNDAIRLFNIAEGLREQGRFSEAEGLYPLMLETHRSKADPGQLDYCFHLSTIADLFSKHGRHQEAEALFVESLSLLRELVGERHPASLAVAKTFLKFMNTHHPNSPHRAEVEALLARSGPGES